jgi:LemA protein
MQGIHNYGVMKSARGGNSRSSVIVSIVLITILSFLIYTYNNMVKKEEEVSVAWSQVESNIQRKADLLPNLVKVVKAYAKHEKELFTNITKLRSDANKLLKSSPTSSSVKVAKELQGKLNHSIMQLFAVAENYPDLEASQNFLTLQAEIEGSENRINITRMIYNEAVGDFNAYIRKIPANLLVSFGGFEKKEYFKSDKRAKEKIDLEI